MKYAYITFIFFLGISHYAFSGFRDEIGFSLLAERLGEDLPDGTGITLSQIEAPEGEAYAPNPLDSEFPDKTFTLQSGVVTVLSEGEEIEVFSSHATRVARHAYGIDTAISPSINTIDVWDVNDWLGKGFLGTGNPFTAPLVETNDIQNHSWIGTLGNDSLDTEAIRRLDLAINRDGVLVFTGLNNGSQNPLPNLLSSNYNGISVGLSSGNHSAGQTNVDGQGRQKPDIVAPLSVTSYATPVASGAGALLLEKVNKEASLANASNTEVMKAILMAGATKSEFPSWNNTVSVPLDTTYGVGELNIFHSYFLLTSGEQEASPTELVPTTGWDFAQASDSSTRQYFFEVVAGQELTDLSVVLTWNRQVSGSFSDIQSFLANLELRLFSSSGLVPTGPPIAESLSAVDNVEHIFIETLGPGQYVLEVTSDTNNIDYGLAWRGLQPLEEPEIISTTIDAEFQTFTVELREATETLSSIFRVEGTSDLSDPSSWSEIPAVQSGADEFGIQTMTFDIPSEDRFFWRIESLAP